VGGACGTHVRGEESVRGLWWEIPDETDHLELQGLDERMGSECIFGRLAGVWSGSSWLRIGADGGLL
jgi:hypothetical protein